ncbi:MAG: hemin ABC transporter substrate-binding protein [Rhodothermales bacterium]
MLWLLLVCSLLVPSVLAQDPPRLVALGGSVTEIVYALGHGDQLVGVDASSVYPADALVQPQLGYFRQTSAEGVLSLAPTQVLAIASSGPPTALKQIEATGTPVVMVTDETSVAGAKTKIRTIAEALGATDAGEALIAQLDTDLAALPTPSGTAPKVLFIYARGGGTLNVSGTETAAHSMIELAGGINAVTSYEGYRPLTAEAVVAAAPDVILVLDRGLATMGGIDGLLKQPGLALTPAGQARRIVSMDDTLFLSFGPRLGQAVRELHRRLYPTAP